MSGVDAGIQLDGSNDAAPPPLQKEQVSGASDPTSATPSMAGDTVGAEQPDGPDAAELRTERYIHVLLGVLRETNLTPDQRLEAAVSILESGGVYGLDRLADELGPRGDPAIQRLIAQALVTASDPPPDTLEPLLFDLLVLRAEEEVIPDIAEALGRFHSVTLTGRIVALTRDPHAEPELRRKAVLALGYHRTQPVAEHLIDLIQKEPIGPVRQAAFAALSQLTAIQEFGVDTGRWRRWWAHYGRLSGEQWLEAMVHNFARRYARLGTQSRGVQDRLTETQRALYRALPQAERQKMLVQMLTDPLESMRQLALDLTVQRLIDAQSIDADLRAALIGRLDDISPTIRHGAIRMLHDLADEKAADLVAQRLVQGRERDPAVLGEFLVMLSRLPRQEAVPRALALLTDEAVGGQAAGFLAAAVDIDMLSPHQKARAKARVRYRLSGNPTPDPRVIRLLGRIGDEQDWQLVAGWISDGDEPVKTAAAEAWAQAGQPLEFLAEQSGDPVIQPIVVAAARQRGSSAKTLHLLIEHKPDQDQAIEAWERAVVAMASRVPVPAVLESDRVLGELWQAHKLREQVLSVAIDRLSNGSATQDLSGTDGEGIEGGDNSPSGDPDQENPVLSRASQSEPASTSPINEAAGPGPTTATPDDASISRRRLLIDLLLTRAEVRLTNGNPTLALADYDRVREIFAEPEAGQTPEQIHRYHLRRLGTLLAAGQNDPALSSSAELLARFTAAEPGVPDPALVVQVVVDAASHLIDTEQSDQALSILQRLQKIFNGHLDAGILDRIHELQSVSDASTTAPPDGPMAADPDTADESPDTAASGATE